MITRSFVVLEDGITPEWFQDLCATTSVYVNTSIGWVKCEEPEFRCGNMYGVNDNEGKV